MPKVNMLTPMTWPAVAVRLLNSWAAAAPLLPEVEAAVAALQTTEYSCLHRAHKLALLTALCQGASAATPIVNVRCCGGVDVGVGGSVEVLFGC